MGSLYSTVDEVTTISIMKLLFVLTFVGIVCASPAPQFENEFEEEDRLFLLDLLGNTARNCDATCPVICVRQSLFLGGWRCPVGVTPSLNTAGALAGGAVGGAIGAHAGPLGAVIGGLAGAKVGASGK